MSPKESKKHPQLEQFLTAAIAKNADVRLRPVVGRDGHVEFYMHIQDHDSDTLDFQVQGNTLIQLHHRGAGG